jgi:hypothetical protein
MCHSAIFICQVATLTGRVALRAWKKNLQAVNTSEGRKECSCNIAE